MRQRDFRNQTKHHPCVNAPSIQLLFVLLGNNAATGDRVLLINTLAASVERRPRGLWASRYKRTPGPANQHYKYSIRGLAAAFRRLYRSCLACALKLERNNEIAPCSKFHGATYSILLSCFTILSSMSILPRTPRSKCGTNSSLPAECSNTGHRSRDLPSICRTHDPARRSPNKWGPQETPYARPSGLSKSE
jgi:hypothetical protein